MGDGGAGWRRLRKVFAIELIVQREIFGVAHVVSRLNHVGQIASCGLENPPDVFDAASKLALEGIADNVAREIYGGLTGDKDEIADNHTGAEGQMRGRGVWELGIRDERMVHGRKDMNGSTRQSSSSDQFWNGATIADDMNGSAVEVVDGDFRGVDSEMMINGG